MTSGGSLEDRQEILFGKVKAKSTKIRNLLEARSPSYPFVETHHLRQRALELFPRHRKLVGELRSLTYDMRLSGHDDCQAMAHRSSWIDPCETTTNWTARYATPNLQLKKLTLGSSSRISLGDDGYYRGLWQLLANSFPEDSHVFDAWAERLRGELQSLPLVDHWQVLEEIGELLKGAELEGALAVDLETTSQSPMDGEILEIGIVEIRGSNPLEWPRFSLKFGLSSNRARRLGTGPSWLHGIQVEDTYGRPSFASPDVQKLLSAYLCSGKRLIFHNGSFEFKWLSHYLDGFFEANIDPRGFPRFLDSSILSKIAFQLGGGHGIRGNGLSTIADHLDVDYGSYAHRAMGDAATTALCSYLMLEAASDSPGMLQVPRGEDLKTFLNSELLAV